MVLQSESCPGICKDGRRCRATPGRSGFCFVHDPGLEEKRNDARRQGGRNSAWKVRLERSEGSLKPISDLLCGALEDICNGGLEPPRAQALARLIAVYLKVRESGLVDDRLKALEEIVGYSASSI